MMKRHIAPAPAHLPDSMMDSVKLLPKSERLILFTRHSLRQRSDKNGFASFDLPLTPNGRVLATGWGRRFYIAMGRWGKSRNMDAGWLYYY